MNAIPVFGWAIALLFNISTAVPFWIVWTACGIGRKYFYFLPDVYQAVGFWECVGLFTAIGILKRMLTPQLASVTQSNDSKSS